jgi:membrane-associated phospholipid phosphatase
MMDCRPVLLRAFAPLFCAYAATLAVSVALLWLRGIAVSPASWGSIGAIMAICVGLVGAGWVLRTERALLGALCAAAFIAMPPGLAAFSYATTSLGGMLPLQDVLFAELDAAIGFDWLAVISFTNGFPLAIDAMRAAYDYTMAAVVYVYVMLVMMKRGDRILEFSFALLLTCIAANVLSGLLPAIGAYIHHQPPSEIRTMIAPDAGIWHLAHFEALRAGTFDVFAMKQTEGLVTFPSYHTACALLVPLALRGLGAVTAVAWAFAAVVTASTIPIGGHYLVDVIAGAALSLGAVAALSRRRWLEDAGRPIPDGARQAWTAPGAANS